MIPRAGGYWVDIRKDGSTRMDGCWCCWKLEGNCFTIEHDATIIYWSSIYGGGKGHGLLEDGRPWTTLQR